jgi:hypothetical protein
LMELAFPRIFSIAASLHDADARRHLQFFTRCVHFRSIPN